MPEYIAGAVAEGAVAGEITDAGDGPAGARMHAETDAGDLLGGIVEHPLVDVSVGGVVPQHAIDAAASEVADGDDVVAGRMQAEARQYACGPLRCALNCEHPNIGILASDCPRRIIFGELYAATA